MKKGYSENEKIKLIVMNSEMKDAVSDLIDMKICSSKAEAKRVYHQVRSIHNKKMKASK